MKLVKIIALLVIPHIAHITHTKIISPSSVRLTGLDKFEQEMYKWSPTFAEVAQLIHTKYYQDIEPKDAMIKAINAFVSFDPHSQLFDPEAFTNILETTRGEFSGIGIVVDNLKDPEEEFLRIVDTIQGGPSDKVGIQADDKIVEIEGESLKGMTVEEAIAKLKGKRGSSVHVKVIRAGHQKLLSFDIIRDTVEVQHATCYHFYEHNIFYLALTMFTENSCKQIEKLLQKSQEQKCKGLILDLRNNSGGLLNSSIDIAGLFLDKNSLVVTTKDRNKKVIEEYRTNRQPIYNSVVPIFILENNYTASAAEILIGCLKAYAQTEKKNKRNLLVFVIGTNSFGKGSVQEVIPLSNNCALKITTALYYLPDDVSIQGVGIKPDFEIETKFPPTDEMKWFNSFFGRESALKKSIKPDKKDGTAQKKNEKKKQEKSWQERKKEQIGSDYIIQSTLRMIEMFDLAKKCSPDQVKNRADAITFLQTHFNPQDTIMMHEIKV